MVTTIGGEWVKRSPVKITLNKPVIGNKNWPPN